MYDLQVAIEEWIAQLPDEDWRALVARTRPPDCPSEAGVAMISCGVGGG
ncbi:hypothetical protein [Mycobacterium marinum]|nr:hypothetical protein [Mycobacterium marinum]